MKTYDIDDLNKHFSIDNNTRLSFRMGKGDIPVIKINNNFASAEISLQGAHILSWIPKDQDELIWVSTDATFAKGKSVRGGIPICWPWFGAHESQEGYPAHGFARTVPWSVKQTKSLDNGETQIIFILNTAELEQHLKAMWPQKTTAEYQVTIGERLKLQLVTTNQGEEDIILGQALHTYFNINDISKTIVTGLEDKEYLDKTANFERKKQVGHIVIDQEVDRIYLQTADEVVIDDAIRKISITKQGSHSTVVWNPWQEVANKMGDLGEDGYRHMLCVESANAAEDTLTLAPGESHTLKVEYKIF